MTAPSVAQASELDLCQTVRGLVLAQFIRQTGFNFLRDSSKRISDSSVTFSIRITREADHIIAVIRVYDVAGK